MRPIVIAHRGASAYRPENTVEAILKAVELGANAVEVDVRRSRDGELVVIHDESLRRVAGLNVKVSELSYEQLRKVRLKEGGWIPTLPEVIEITKSKAALVVEAKEEGFEHELVGLLQGLEEVTVTSFIHRSVKKVKELARQLETGVIYTCLPVKVVDLALDAEADAIFPRRDFTTVEVVEEAHRHGLKVYPWTVDDVDEAVCLAKLGVDGLVTNRPDVVLEALRRAGL